MQIMTPLLSVAFIGSAFALGRYTDLKPKQMLLIGIVALSAQQALAYAMNRKDSSSSDSKVVYSPSTEKVPSTKKVAILIHGCHLQAKEWDNIVFGTPEQLGRVPLAIKIAIEENASLMIWGSGTSHTEEKTAESEYTYSQALGPKLEELARLVKMEPQLLSKHIQNISVIDLAARNTLEELQCFVDECHSQGITKLILVSSPTHIARCHQLACQMKSQLSEQSEHPVEFWAIASDTCYADSVPGDVTIIEPPHRGDKAAVPFHLTAKLIFQFLEHPERAREYNAEWRALTERHLEKIKNPENPST